ncbi:TonB-dependent receptor [Phocaeicola dorei]|nr:TonB-dependent receptor [Phocaeicola dorei]
MRANILFCLCFFMGLVTQLNAQITITGKVIDEQQQLIPYANVVLLSLPDSAFVSGSVSNEEGVFSLNAEETKGVLRISSIGYVTVYRLWDSRNTTLGIIRLASDTQMLAEVVVKADIPVTRIRGDALVTNIQNSILSKAGSASDVLGKVPGVIKERDSYEVLGKGTPLIYINGRQVRDDSELDQLNSEDIKSVEVVTNPGAL